MTILDQLAGLFAVATDHRFNGVKRIKQKMGVHLGVKQFDL